MKNDKIIRIQEWVHRFSFSQVAVLDISRDLNIDLKILYEKNCLKIRSFVFTSPLQVAGYPILTSISSLFAPYELIKYIAKRQVRPIYWPKIE